MAVRQLALPVGLLVLAAVTALLAVGDHWYKQRRLDRLEAAFWYCRHQGTRCGGPGRPAALSIERRWNERQVGYEIVVGLSAAAGAVLLAARVRRR